MTIDQRLEAIERNLCKINELLRHKPGDNPVLERQQIETDPKSIDMPALKPLIHDWEVLEVKCVRADCGARLGEIRSISRQQEDIYLHYGCCVDSGHFAIHSVRRVSDGTIWSIGDVVDNQLRGSGRISKFSINKNGVMLVEADCFTMPWSLLNIVAARSIYTSADGVAIFEGDTVYFWSPDGQIHNDDAHPNHNPEKHYSTKAAAETAYKNWLQSQRVLSLGDVLNKDAGELEELVKSRLV